MTQNTPTPLILAALLALLTVPPTLACAPSQPTSPPPTPYTQSLQHIHISIQNTHPDPKLTRTAQTLQDSLSQNVRLYNIAFPNPTPSRTTLRLHGTILPGKHTDAPLLSWTFQYTPTGETISQGNLPVDTILRQNAHTWLTKIFPHNLSAYGAQPTTQPNAYTPPSSPSSSCDGSQSWAVVIGVESYSNVAKAPYAERDARAFAHFAEHTLNIPPTHIKLLVGEYTNRADLAAALQEWLPRNAHNTPGNLYIFFSGHGTTHLNTGTPYLVPRDADLNYLKTRGFSLQTLYTELAKIHAAHTYVFLDTSFSGTGQRSVFPQGARPLVPITPTLPQGTITTFAASPHDRPAHVHNDAAHGLFTHTLLTGLRGQADSDGDRSISLHELHTFLQSQTPKDTPSPTLLNPPNDTTTPTLVQGLHNQP